MIGIPGRRPLFLTSLAALGLTLSTMASAENLIEVYEDAFANDPQYLAAQAAYQSALESRPQARSGLLPQLQLEGGVTRNREDFLSAESQIFQEDTLWSTEASVDLRLTQSLYDKERFVQLRQADAQIAQAEAELEASRQELALRVAEAYFGVLSAKDNLRFARAEKKAIGRQLEQAQQRFEVGLIAITDVKEAQARFDVAVADEIAAENAYDDAREELTVITGEVYSALAILAETIELAPPDPTDRADWVSTARDQNPALLAARAGSDVAKTAIDRQRAQYHPDLDLVGTANLRDTSGGSFGSSTQQNSSIGVQFSVPLYAGGRRGSQVRQANADFDQAQEELTRQDRNTVRQTRNAYRGVLAGISRVEALRQALDSSRTALEATEAGFEVGTRTSVDVLIALQDLFGAERDFAQARYEYLLETLRLKRAAGILAPQNLESINGLLRAEKPLKPLEAVEEDQPLNGDATDDEGTSAPAANADT